MTLADTQRARPRLSGQEAGLFILVSAMIFSVGIDVFVRLLSAHLPVSQILVLRGAVSILLLMPWILYTGGAAVVTGRLDLHLLRGTVGSLTSYLIFYAVSTVPLADVGVYLLSEPFFVLPLAILFLGERATPIRVAAILCGVLGVLIVLWPDLGRAEAPFLGIAAALGAAFLLAVQAILIRRMAASETAVAVIFYQQLIGIALFAPVAASGWQPVPLGLAPLVLGLSAVMLVFHAMLVVAYRKAEASLLAPASASAVPFAALAGWLFFAEAPTAYLWAGLTVITASLVLAGRGARSG